MANGGNGLRQTQSQSRMNAETLGVLRERVDGLGRELQQLDRDFASRMGELSNAISSLAQKFDARQHIPWQGVSVGLGALVAIATLAYWPILTTQNRIETSLTRVIDAYVPEKELDAKLSADYARRDDWQRAAIQRMDHIEGELAQRSNLIGTLATKAELDKTVSANVEIRTAERNTTLMRLTRLEDGLDKLLPRTEHEEFRRTQERSTVDQQRQLDELRRFEQDLVSAKDTIRHLEDRVWALDRGGAPAR